MTITASSHYEMVGSLQSGDCGGTIVKSDSLPAWQFGVSLSFFGAGASLAWTGNVSSWPIFDPTAATASKKWIGREWKRIVEPDAPIITTTTMTEQLLYTGGGTSTQPYTSAGAIACGSMGSSYADRLGSTFASVDCCQ